jgi:hypothetical protein
MEIIKVWRLACSLRPLFWNTILLPPQTSIYQARWVGGSLAGV